MTTLLSSFKILKLWQIGVLIAALVGAAGTAYVVYTATNDSGQVRLSENQQLIPAQVGDLINQISTNGSLLYPIREMLYYGTKGIIEEVLVEEGQFVEEGQLLARLDAATVASLDRAAAQARVDLRTAEEALATAQDPYTALDLAQAEASVANAILSLSKSQDALTELKNWPPTEDISKTQYQVDSSTVNLANAIEELSLARTGWDDKIQEAQASLDTALEGYQDVFNTWLGIEVSETEVELSPDTLLNSWGVDLQALFRPNLRYEDTNRGVSAHGLPPDDPATPWSESVLYPWLNFFPGTIAPTCENDVVPSRGVCIKKEMDDAWDTYQGGKETLDTALVQGSKAIAKAEDAVFQAEDSLAASQEALADLRDGPDALDVDVKTKQFAVAQANLAKAKEELAELISGVDPLEEALREAKLASAQLALQEALQRLEGASLKAAMAGIVSLVNVEAGQEVNPNTRIVEVADPTVVEVDAVVDEIDVLFVRKGARASVTMDALPGQELEGTVSAIASAPMTEQGVVSYPIRIQVQVPEGLQLPEGLSATAKIVLQEERNVLLIPLQALHGSFEQPLVRVMNNGRVEERAVVLGNNDDFWVAVLEGLMEGEQVVMESEQASTTGAGFRGLLGGGGFGGGRGRGGGGGGGGGGGNR